MVYLLVFLGVLTGITGYYLWLLLHVGPPPAREAVAGQGYRVGAAWVHRVPAETAETAETGVTIVAMHGLLQSPAYFTALYRERPDAEVILIGSGDYHPVLASESEQTPAWATRPKARPGTIAYDAAVLRQAVTHLAQGRDLWLHGHSRGGAVVVEAARQDPAQFRRAHFLLEAPVLPGAALFRPLPRGTLAAVPWLLPLWRREPLNARIRPVVGRLSDERKRRLMAAMPVNPRRALTVIRNIRDIHGWMRGIGPEVLAELADVEVLTTPKDRILDTERMEAAARAGGDHVRVTRLRGVSHFISLDQPDAVHSAMTR